MSTLFFNTKYKVMNIAAFAKCIDYYNRDDRADKNLLNQKSADENAEDMFSYYFYRKGSSGCFDFNGDKSYEAIMDEYQHYRPNYIWQSIISFTREDAFDFNLKEKKDFAALTKKVVIRMAKEKGIPLRDVAWGGFYHVNTDHPHVHFYFYDKRNPFDNSLFSKRSIEKIRAAIGREVVDRSILLKAKENTSRKILLDTRAIVNDTVFLKELEKYRTSRFTECSDFINPKFSVRADMFKQLQYLNEILPKKGRLSYNAHVLDPYRKDIDKMVDIMLNQKGIKDDFRIFKHQLEDVYHTNESLYGEGKRQQDYLDDQMHRLYSNLGNAVLKMLKSYRQYAESQPNLKFEKYLSLADIRKENLKMMRPYGYDLIRFSFKSLRHEISLLRQMQRIRDRNQRTMLHEIEREQREKEKEEKEVEYASS